VGTATSRLVPASAPLSHRIESEVAESAAGDYAPIIETAHEAHRSRAQAAKSVSPSPDAQPGQKTGERGWKPNISRDREAIIECGYRVWAKPALARRDLEPCLAWNRIGPPAASNQFHAISTGRVRCTRSENSRQRPSARVVRGAPM
jgi:hypothetical protein